MLRVVIADDEEKICDYLLVVIDWEENGCEIVGVAHDGAEVVSLCMEKTPNILLTDIRMPGLNGLEAIKRLHSEIPTINIIIITGYDYFAYAQTAIKYGVIEYLLKPVRKEDLLAALHKAQKNWMVNRPYEIIDDNTHNTAEIERIENLTRVIHEYERNGRILDTLYILNTFGNHYAIWQMIYVRLQSINKRNDSSSIKFLVTKIKNMIFDIFESNENNQIDIFFIPSNIEGIYILLNLAKEEMNDVDRKVELFQRNLDSVIVLFYNYRYVISVSEPFYDVKKVKDGLQDCMIADADKIRLGSNILIYSKDHKTIRKNLNFISVDTINRFKEFIVSNNTNEVFLLITELTTNLETIQDQLHGFMIFEIYSKLIDVFYSNIYQGTPNNKLISEEKTKLKSQYDSFYTIRDAFNFLRDSFVGYMKMISETLDDANEDRPIIRAKSIIDRNYSDPELNLDSVSSQVGLNSSYLSTIFKKKFKVSFIDYLTEVRIKHAKELLLSTDDSVAVISEAVGFVDSKYFTKRFKKYTGVSPRDYKKYFSMLT